MPLHLTDTAARDQDPANLFNRAIVLLRAADPAATSLLRHLERFPDYGAGWLALGVFLQEAGKYDAALMALGRAARAGPASAVAAHRLGQCLASLGRRGAAIQSFRESVRIDPAFADGWYSLGLASQDQGDHEAAVSAYRAALSARPDFHQAAFNLGVALQQTGALDCALEAYGTAWRLRPDSLARIAQALTSGDRGVLWLDPAALRRRLSEARDKPSGSARNP